MTDSSNLAQAWGAVAEAWDANVNDIDEHSVEATAALLDRVSVQPGERVLELAAGPGSLGPTWSRLVGPAGEVVVSDVAPAMIEVARARNAEFPNVHTAVRDLAAIAEPDGLFDIVACRMGLMFTLDPAVAMAEIFRVLRPSGRVGVLTWSGMEHNPWMTCVGMAAMVNGLVTGGPPVGPGGIFSLADPDALEQLAKGAGFVDVTVDRIDITFRAESAESHIDRVVSLAGPLATVLHDASDDQRAAFRHTATELAAAYATGDGFAIPGQALVVSARR